MGRHDKRPIFKAQAHVGKTSANKVEARLISTLAMETAGNGALVGARYQTISGNQARSWGNRVAVWAGSKVAWNQDPLTFEKAPKDGTDGDVVLSLPKDPPSPPYIVGYATGASNTSVCATSEVFPGDESATPGDESATPGDEPATPDDESATDFQICLDLPWIGQDSLVVTYETPAGNQPACFHNWIGLWKGETATFDTTNRIFKKKVTGTEAKGSQPFNDLTLLSNSYYTVGYGCGCRNKDLAATITFETDPFLLTLQQFLDRHGTPAVRWLSEFGLELPKPTCES